MCVDTRLICPLRGSADLLSPADHEEAQAVAFPVYAAVTASGFIAAEARFVAIIATRPLAYFAYLMHE